jgi:hypothetical protein
MMYVFTQKYIHIHAFATNLYFVCIVRMYVYVCVCIYKNISRYTNNTYIYMQYRYIHAIHTIETYAYNTLKYIQYILIHTDACMYMYIFVFACITCIM